MPHDGVKADYRQLDATAVYVGNGEIIVCGRPPREDDGATTDDHNCDAMGCGWDHVLYRAPQSSDPWRPRVDEKLTRSDLNMRALAALHRAEEERSEIAEQEALREMRLANDEADEYDLDTVRLDWLEHMANQPGGVLLHGGSRSLRGAIDAAMQSNPPGSPKGVGGGGVVG